MKKYVCTFVLALGFLLILTNSPQLQAQDIPFPYAYHNCQEIIESKMQQLKLTKLVKKKLIPNGDGTINYLLNGHPIKLSSVYEGFHPHLNRRLTIGFSVDTEANNQLLTKIAGKKVYGYMPIIFMECQEERLDNGRLFRYIQKDLYTISSTGLCYYLGSAE